MTGHLRIDGLDHHYGSAQSLRDVSLAIGQGECLALLGRNGAGKTTLLRCMAGLLRPSAGQITFDDHSIAAWPSFRRARAGIGYVPQGREIFADLTVGENLTVSMKAHKVRDSAVLDEVCTLFPVLRTMWRRRGGDLSGGQQQQLAIGRALMGRPRLLLLDEPTEGIQPSIIREMGRQLKRIRDERGLSILVSEQVLSFALDVADRVVVIENGELVHEEAGDAIDGAKISSFLSV
jgi:urea transport system ATP-binding protein